MHVKMHTEKTFELVLTDNESQNVKRISTRAKVSPAKLIEQVLDSAMQAACDQMNDTNEPPWDE